MQPFKKGTRAALLNFLQAKYELYRGAVSVRSRPYYLGLDPSSLCQLRCPICATGVDNETHRQRTGGAIYRDNRTMLRGDLFDAMLDELGDCLFLLMFYNWGEPLLNKHLPGFIRKAADRNIETDVNTNLSLHLNDRDVDELLGSGLDQLSASLDGFSQATYETYRVGGNLELARGNIERFARARTRLGLHTTISWNFMVFAFNEHEVAAARSYCQDLGVEFNARDGYIDEKEWLPSYRRDEVPMARPPQWRRPVVWSPLSPHAERRYASGCAWHYGYSMVNADGSVAPCCASWNQKDDFGRVEPGKTSFADIWNNDLYRNARAVFAGRDSEAPLGRETLCTQCPFGEDIQHLYSLLDVKVIMRVYQDAPPEDAMLGEAFDLLARARYGPEMHGLLRRGTCISEALVESIGEAERLNRPPRGVGRHLSGDEHDMTAFVQFYEKHLAPEMA